jgi:hypothetical protein
MFSLARSRYTLLIQFLFLALNACGVLLGVIYNASTPDLYPNNAHHKLGWIVTVLVSAQVVVGLLARVAGAFKSSKHSRYAGARAEERQGFIPVSTEAMAEHDSCYPYSARRFSHDSGQGTEPRTESLRSHSLSDAPASPMADAHKEYRVSGDGHEDDDDSVDHLPIISKSAKARSVLAKVAERISDRFWKVLLFAYNAVDRTILILGFITISAGIATYGRFFVSGYGKKERRGEIADHDTGGQRYLQRPRPLHQGRRVLLAGYFHSGSLGGLLRRARLGMSPPLPPDKFRPSNGL